MVVLAFLWVFGVNYHFIDTCNAFKAECPFTEAVEHWNDK